MKKFLAIAIIAALMALAPAATVQAAPPQEYPVLKAATPPTIDGVVNADEWQGAKVGYIDNTANLQWGDSENPIKADFYLMWDDAGLYFAAVARDDPSGFVKLADGEEHTKLGDGVQFLVDPSYTVNADEIVQVAHNAFIFDIYPQTPWYEHWIYPPEEGGWYDIRSGKNIVTAGSVNGKTWSVEIFLPWADLQAGGEWPMPNFSVAEGMKMSLGYIIMEMGDSQSGFCSFDGWETVNWDTGVLSTTLGGIIPAPDPEPEPAADEPAAAEEATSAAPAGSPKTSDSGMMFLIALMAMAAAGIVVLRKIKVN